MLPVLPDELSELIHVLLADRVRHRAGEHLHAAERVQDATLARPVRAEHRRDRVAGNARLARVRDDAPAFERCLERWRQWKTFDLRTVAEREGERSAVRRSVMVLAATWDAEILHLDGAALLGERGAVDRIAAPGRDRRIHRDAGRGRATESCAEREVDLDPPPRWRGSTRRARCGRSDRRARPRSPHSPRRRPRTSHRVLRRAGSRSRSSTSMARLYSASAVRSIGSPRQAAIAAFTATPAADEPPSPAPSGKSL